MKTPKNAHLCVFPDFRVRANKKMTICSLCGGEFDIEAEGGIEGDIGIIPVQFCVWCKAGLFDMHEQMRIPIECPECGWLEDDDADPS